MGNPHMGIFKSPRPFLYRDHHMDTVIPLWKIFPYGDFYLNPQMETNSIWKRVSDWTVPVWKRVPISIWGSPYRNGEPCHQAPHMEMGLARFHMGMCLSPFPYGDHHMEARMTQGHVNTTLPISIWGVPVRKWAGRVEYSHMGSPRFRIEFVSIWGLTSAPSELVACWG